MFKFFTSVIICIFIQLIFVHSDETLQIDVCSDVKCAEIKNCPAGTYLSWLRPELGKCCATCEPYAKLGEVCNDTVYCSPNLLCPYSLNGEIEADTVCVYSWENGRNKRKCDTSNCPTYKACPENSFLMKHNDETICCDQCIQNSKYGEYCDHKQPCISGLNCVANSCAESESCSEKKKTCEVTSSCGADTYIIPANGLDLCCDKCQAYSKLGEECGNDRYCNFLVTCDYKTETCVEYKNDCSMIDCAYGDKESSCKNGVWVPSDGVNVCCPYCRPYANYGQFCNDENPCIPKFVCKNSTCDLNDCNCT